MTQKDDIDYLKHKITLLEATLFEVRQRVIELERRAYEKKNND